MTTPTSSSSVRGTRGGAPPCCRPCARRVSPIDHSEGGLYLWATRGEPCQDSVAWLAARGILVAPGDFYGPRGAQHVRVALTATDERIAAAVHRLT